MDNASHLDPKADKMTLDKISFLHKPQNAYGEWLKRSNIGDIPPRGKCGQFFDKHESSKLAYTRSRPFSDF